MGFSLKYLKYFCLFGILASFQVIFGSGVAIAASDDYSHRLRYSLFMHASQKTKGN
jgi:hypothetical protein